MDCRLLVLDIDGTVANSEKEVPEHTRKAVIRLQERGVRVVLASGRPPEGVYPVAKRLCLEQFGSYILAFNGGKIIDCRTRQCIFERKLPRHIPIRLWQDAVKYQVGFAVYREGMILAGTEPDAYMETESAVSGLPLRYCKEFGNHADVLVNECLLTGPPQELEAICPVLSHRYFHETQVFQSEPCYLEVTPKNVDKAYGLKHLLKLLQIRREDMACCGDSFNDIRMIQYAGLGIAMANAVDPLKAAADYVTVNDNDHDGVAEVIETFFLS